MRASSPVESFSARPAISDACLSEHEIAMPAANTATTKPKSLRFMTVTMNRATCFSRASNYFSACDAARARVNGNSIETVNAERAARDYIRQAKRLFRHWKLRWFPWSSRAKVSRAIHHVRRFACAAKKLSVVRPTTAANV